jgi:hypothetical protein
VPRLRFTRDERGYEHTFLVHTSRRRGRERTQVLYWFRSPPSVRVGRAAFDPAAIRGIEEANPDIVFDWPSILEARPTEPEPAEGWRARRQRAREQRNGQAPASPMAAVPAQPPAAPTDSPIAARGAGSWETSDEGAIGSAPDNAEPDRAGERAVELSAVQRALGSEGLTRVRARYAEVLARIGGQVTDAATATELRDLAERLNPDAWVTHDDVRVGLEQFERVLETVRQRLGPPRRRRGEGQQGAPPPETPQTGTSTAIETTDPVPLEPPPD